MTAFNRINPWLPLFLGFSRCLALLDREIRPSYSLNEGAVMGALEGRAQIDAARLVRELGIEKSVLSRLLASLERRGLVAYEQADRDKRRKSLSLTEFGRQCLAEYSRLLGVHDRLSVSRLSKEQIDVLIRVQRHMADRLGIEALPAEERADPLGREIGRLSRGFGFYGENFLGTESPSRVCQALFILSGVQKEMPLSELQLRLPYERTTASRLLSMLAREGVVKAGVSGEDHRKHTILLTDKGRELWAEVSKRGEGYLENLLNGVACSDLLSLQSVLLALQPARLPDSSQVRISCIEHDQGRQAARAFAIEMLVRTGKHKQAPQVIVADESLLVELSFSGRLSALAEIWVAEEIGRLNVFVCDEAEGLSSLDILLLKAIVRDVLIARRCRALEVPEATGAVPIFRCLKAESELDEGRLVLTQEDIGTLERAFA